MHIEIGSSEARTRLPELLRNVRSGKRYTITLRGKPMADLVPAESAKGRNGVAAVERMRRLMLEAAPVKGVDVKALIDEGRTHVFVATLDVDLEKAARKAGVKRFDPV